MSHCLRIPLIVSLLCVSPLVNALTTTGYDDVQRTELPGTLLSHPASNDSANIGRTVTLNYLNGWLLVGAEAPGSAPGSDLELRVYDVSDPANPIRRRPSDFELTYPFDSWHQGNSGWNAHGTAQSGSFMLPDVLRVEAFGQTVERGVWDLDNGVPDIGNFPIRWNRSSMAGPWSATLSWYGAVDTAYEIQRVSLNQSGYSEAETVATFDHQAVYGGGDWHPIFFGDLLIYVRSGTSASDGVVVYRLQYNNFDQPGQRSITPQLVGTLPGGFQGYWPNLFSDGDGLYVTGATTNVLMVADLSQAADPNGNGSVVQGPILTVPNFTNASYPVYQDHYAFIHNRKINMTQFLAGQGLNAIELTLNEADPPVPAGAAAPPTGVDTSQMSLVMGNLWVTGGYPINPGSDNYHSQGMAVWVHQQAPDTTAPKVTYHIPQANRLNYPRHAPLSFLLHEHSRAGGPRNGVDFSVRLVQQQGGGESLGAAVAGFLIHDFGGVLTFTPDQPLQENATYEVRFHSDPANEIGFRDVAGNYIEPYVFRFSTGTDLAATDVPAISQFTADVYQPAPNQTITVSLTAAGSTGLQYRFNFEGSWTDWSATPQAQHIYTQEGYWRVLVQVRDDNGNLVTESLRVLVIDPPSGPRATQSSTLAVGNDPAGRRVWVVNPDADTVTVLDAVTGAYVQEYLQGDGANPRGIARDAQGRYWVTHHGADRIRVLNADGTIAQDIALDYGAAPYGIAASLDGEAMFVTLQGSAQIQRYDTNATGAQPLTQSTFPTPRAIAISADGARVLVTRFISPELRGEVAEFDGATLAPVRTIPLGFSISRDGGDRSGGVPNYLAGIAISPDGSRAAVVSKQDNTQRGTLFGVGDLTFETTVRSVVSFIDLTTNAEVPNTRRDIDNSDSPSAVTYSPFGDTLLVALQGNNRVVGLDTLSLAPTADAVIGNSTYITPAVISLDASVGLAPQGMLLDQTTGRLFVQNFMDRTVTVRDAQPWLQENRASLPLLATTPTVTQELLPPDVLQGKQIFYNAADTRMSADGYISCASCHVDGGHDGRVWDFTGRGEGLRRTTDLRGRAGMQHGNVHWSGNFDEIQDFEHDIRGPFGGTGFLNLTPAAFAQQHASPVSAKAGLSDELDALAAYVASLDASHTPRSPWRNSDGTHSADALAGRQLFEDAGCSGCHAGTALTNSAVSNPANTALVNLGTLSGLSGNRLGGLLNGIDVPTLHGLHATETFLHHGQAGDLSAVFAYTGGTLLLANDAEFVTTGLANAVAGMQSWQHDPDQGGGGFARGLIGGAAVNITRMQAGAEQPGVRFNAVDGGQGGSARIAIRYVRQYNATQAVLRVNGVDHPFTLQRQEPDFGWNVGGWRWAVVDVTLQAGATNTIDVLVGDIPGNNLYLNAIMVANADQLAGDPVHGQAHRQVLSFPGMQQTQLMAFLREQDGRDELGNPLTPPAQPTPTPAPTATPTPAPTATPTPAPTATPTPAPTATPTPAPTAAPTSAPTAAPTPAPTAAPTPAPTAAPTPAPTAAPTPAPTAAPTPAPTTTPTPAPTAAPTPAPTATPTPAPTATPAPAPTATPTPAPTPTPTPTPGAGFDDGVTTCQVPGCAATTNGNGTRQVSLQHPRQDGSGTTELVIQRHPADPTQGSRIEWQQRDAQGSSVRQAAFTSMLPETRFTVADDAAGQMTVQASAERSDGTRITLNITANGEVHYQLQTPDGMVTETRLQLPNAQVQLTEAGELVATLPVTVAGDTLRVRLDVRGDGQGIVVIERFDAARGVWAHAHNTIDPIRPLAPGHRITVSDDGVLIDTPVMDDLIF